MHWFLSVSMQLVPCAPCTNQEINIGNKRLDEKKKAEFYRGKYCIRLPEKVYADEEKQKRRVDTRS